ncbi:hypothetical protein ACO1DC_13645 [Bacillus velezensis]
MNTMAIAGAGIIVIVGIGALVVLAPELGEAATCVQHSFITISIIEQAAPCSRNAQ